MLLQEKMQTIKVSANETTILNFILSKQENIAAYSTTKLATETFTSPSTVIRVAHKLGFSGWLEFRQSFVQECSYLHANFKNVDANKPFDPQDRLTTMANKIAQVKKESLNDTLYLLDEDKLQHSIALLAKYSNIKVFALANLIFAGEELVYKLRHIQKNAEIFSIQNVMYQEALLTTKNDCAICLSYSGESAEILKVAQLLKQKNTPIIAITSIGNNSLARLADVTLNVTTREKSYSKIGGFSSLESINLLLDVLYVGLFQQNYQANYQNKIELARQTELRDIDNHIIQED